MSWIDWYSLRKKDTGEVFTVGSISYGSDTIYNIYNYRGIVYKIPESTIKEEYEHEELDFSKYADKFLGLAKMDSSFRECFYKLARRLDPDYYKVGVTVYFQNSMYTLRKDTYIPFGAEYPYTITEITQDHSRPGLYWIYLSRGIDVEALTEDELNNIEARKRKNTLDGRVDFRLPLYMNSFENGDAYDCLKRYDKPY